MSYEKATIMAVLNRIHSGDLILPDIQRDFVWGTDRIYKLLDSILRSYPFGTLLFWNTKLRVQYREFIKDWADDRVYTFRIKEAGQPRTLVLDGQQRLQSLYIAVFGSYEQQMLYFDLLSGGHQQDVSELRFVCEFMSPARCDELNRNSGGQVYWVPLRDIVMIPDWSLLGVRTEDYQTKAGIAAASPEGIRLNSNLQTLFHTFRTGEVLNYFTQDKDCEGGKQPTPLDEILEVFVRVNSGGQVLSKSDLMFSLLQLHWPDAAAEIADLIDELNSKGRFEFDKDFVLKCALVCCGRGARYDVAKLREPTTLTEIKTAFPKITNALINCVDFVVGTAKFRDGRILGSYNALIPFVYFYYLQPSQQVRQEAALVAMNQVLYLALMTSAFSRYSDNRVDHVVERILKPVQAAQPGVFPLDALCAYIDAQEHHSHIDNALLQRNVPLLMNILEGGSLLPEGRRHYRPEFDHIFPRSKLPPHGYSETQVNDFANFRLISKQHNIWKSNQDPKTYFTQQPGLMQRYLIPAQYLDYDEFPTFLEERRKLIWEQVRRFLGMGDGPSQSSGADDMTTQRSNTLPVGTTDAKTPNVATGGGTAQPPDAAERLTLIKRVLSRLPPSNGQRAVYRALYQAGDAGLTWRQLYEGTGRTDREMMGTLGTLGRRINDTDGAERFDQPGIVLLLDVRRVGGNLCYWLQPFFRRALDEDPDLKSRALKN